MTQTPLGLALIGCGDIAPMHARALQSTTAAKLVACMDLIESSAKGLGDEYAVPYFTKLDDILSLPEVEAVLIATPAFTHADLAEQAAKAGKAVICEKPIAAALSDADRMIAACKREGVSLSTCFPLRWLAGAQWSRELIQAGALGEVIEIRMSSLGEKQESYWTGGYSGRTQTDWRKFKAASGGGVVITNLVHNIDLARFITGLDVTRAYAEAGTFCTDVEVEDVALASLRYQNGAIGLVDGSSCFYGGSGEWDMTFLGTKGQIRFGYWNKVTEVYLTEPHSDLPAREWIRREQESAPWVDFHNAFAAAVRARQTPPVTGEDGRAGLEVALAIYRAAETNAPVRLPL
jgi:predicted dehydrogenase